MKLFDRRLLGAFVACIVAIFGVNQSSSGRLQAQSGASGGFVESDSSTSARPPLSPAQIAGFLPTRGTFTFPAPYNTQGIRLTNGGDCGGGDCVRPVGYSYWRNINNHVGSDTMLVFLSLDRRSGGTGPTLFSYNKASGETRNLGPLFDASSQFGDAAGEGWYFSATLPTKMYISSGAQLFRYDVLSKSLETVFDARARFGSDKLIWQIHSSNDDNVHSFTLRQDGSYAMLGCAAYNEATQQYSYFPARGDFDECQIDKSGRFLVIKENIDGQAGEDNVIEDLQTGAERIYYDQQGAGGHSDAGFGYSVAEDNWNAQPGAVRLFRFDQDQSDSSNGNGTLVFHSTDWNVSAGHISHANAQPGTPISQQYACSATATRAILPRSNEVLCYRLDGGLQSLVVAPVMTDLNASGGGGEDYFKFPKGNLDVTGEYYIWTSNLGGNRLDAIIARIPTQLIPTGGNPIPTPSPSPSPAPTPAPAPTPTPGSVAPVQWTNLVNTSVSGTVLQRTSGCDGCDGGAVSAQQIASGDGYVEFTASETSLLRAIGLSNGNPGTSFAEIQFALRLQAGWAEVRENGVYRWDTPFTTGDILRIAVSGGQVRYSKNGAVFYTSAGSPTYPLLVDTAFAELNATISNAVIGAGAGSGGSDVRMALDGPSGQVAQPFVIGGWAVDLGAPAGVGVDAVHVWAWPTSGASPVMVSATAVGGSRPDVAAVFGSQFSASGYGLAVSGLTPGSYKLVASARSTLTGEFSHSRPLDITIESHGIVTIDAPRPGQHLGRSFAIGGWAVDLADSSGLAGVDAVHVYAQPRNGGALQFLGEAAIGGNRPDVGAVFGNRYTPSGYNLLANLAPGAYDLIVFARSADCRSVNSSVVSIVVD